MSNTVIGNFTAVGLEPWHEIDRSDLDQDDYGIDSLNRIYSVRPDSLAAFKLAFRKGVMDLTFPWLYVVGLKGNVTGIPYTFTVIFKGAQIANGANPNDIRKEHETGGLARLQVSLQSLSFDIESGPTQKQVSYKAPYTEWKYVSTQHPKILGPRHTGEVNSNQLVATVLSADGSTSTDWNVLTVILLPGQAPVLPASPPTFLGFLKIDGQKFDYEQVGNVWTVIERNQLVVVDYQAALQNAKFDW